MAVNPLFKHFRQPSVYVKLPSKGKFWPPDALDMPPNEELPVYPMTIKDEVLIKTPDALMNGSGVANVIQSCCPNIKDPWALPATDLDTLLISIRIASYGSFMDVDTSCPHCKAENTHPVDLRVLIDEVKTPNFDPIEINDLTFHFRPQTFKSLNANNLISYEQQKLIDAITNSDLPEEEKTKQFNLMFPRLTDMNIMALVSCIEGIEVDSNYVSDMNHIKEFVSNCDRSIYKAIREQVDQIINSSKIPPVNMQCNECSEQYSTEILFEQSNFFE
jgi:bacterioferritin-associated ferredoxin